jgi:acetyltransferase-like isoleucine patch superfamily enzyme
MIKEFISSLLLYICNYWIAFVPFYAIRHAYYRSLMGFKIGRGSSICMGARFRRYGRVTIGNNCVIHENVVFSNLDEIVIKDCAVVGPQCYIHTSDHDVYHREFTTRTAPVVIGDHAFVGLRSILLKGVNIEDNAVVAAGSLVTKSVGASEIVAGTPAKVVGRRDALMNYVPHYKPLFR